MDPNEKKIRIEFLYFFSVILFIIINLLGLSKSFSTGVNIVFTPLISVGGEIGNGIKSASEALTSIFDIRNERNQLLIENAELEAQMATIILLQDEIDTLRSELDFDKDVLDSIQASILSWGYGNIEGNLILNKGSLDGVKYGQVVTVGSVYIGWINDVSDTTSTVLIPSNNRSTFEVLIAPYRESFETTDKKGINNIVNKERSQLWGAVAIGDNGSILLENIPKNSSVKVGDHVIISDKDIPEHYYLGDITKVIVDPTDVQIKAVVSQPLSIENLTKVFIRMESE